MLEREFNGSHMAQVTFGWQPLDQPLRMWRTEKHFLNGHGRSVNWTRNHSPADCRITTGPSKSVSSTTDSVCDYHFSRRFIQQNTRRQISEIITKEEIKNLPERMYSFPKSLPHNFHLLYWTVFNINLYFDTKTASNMLEIKHNTLLIIAWNRSYVCLKHDLLH